MFGESFGDGPANAARGASDDRDPAGQIEQTAQGFLQVLGAASTIALFDAPTPEAIGSGFAVFPRLPRRSEAGGADAGPYRDLLCAPAVILARIKVVANLTEMATKR